MYSKVIQLYKYVSIHFQILSPFRLLQDIERSSLCSAVDPFWLSVLNTAVCMSVQQCICVHSLFVIRPTNDEMKSESESHSVVSNCLRPHGLYNPWNSPGQNTGVGSLSLLQGIFLSQGSNWGLLFAGRFFTNWAIREACTNDEKNTKLDLNIQFFLERFYTVSVQVVETSLFVFNVLFCIGVCQNSPS